MNAPQLRPDLYTGTQCAALDALACSDWGFSSDRLMAKAGADAFAALQQRWPMAQRLCICAGVGNNAGDGYVVARLAQAAGCTVVVLQLHDRTLSGAAGRAQQAAQQAGVRVVAVEIEDLGSDPVRRALADADLLVDAMLGIGLTSAPRAAFAALIDAMNMAVAPVLALDVPSGLDADASAPFAEAVRAELTVTFIVDKICLRTGVGKSLAGEVQVCDLGLPARLRQQQPGLPHVDLHALSLPSLGISSYKHGRGHVVVVGGDQGMHGAVLLTAEAALRSGAGLVSVITRGEAISGLLAHRPELMVMDAKRRESARGLLEKATVIVCGPGLGQGAWGRELLNQVLEVAAGPHAPRCVFDADALNLLAADPARCPRGAVLTPHSGEAARLLACASAQIEQDRVSAARRLAAAVAGVAVLKGPGSLVATAERCSVCAHGNPGMASAGMGDVLAGVTGAVVAQQLASAPVTLPELAAGVTAAVTLHSAAADVAAQQGSMRSLIASDLLRALPALLANFE